MMMEMEKKMELRIFDERGTGSIENAFGKIEFGE